MAGQFNSRSQPPFYIDWYSFPDGIYNFSLTTGDEGDGWQVETI